MPTPPATLHVRPPLARMWHIHQRLQEGRYPDSESLGRELRVASRTVKRDIDFMRDRFSLPIEYNAKRYGFYYTEPVKQFLGPLGLTEAEVFALLIADKATEQYRGTPFQKPLHETYRRLIGMLDSKSAVVLATLGDALSIRPFAPGDADVEKFEILTQALRQRRRTTSRDRASCYRGRAAAADGRSRRCSTLGSQTG